MAELPSYKSKPDSMATIVKTAKEMGFIVISESESSYIFDTKGKRFTEGIFTKTTYIRQAGAIWLSNDARNANIAEDRIVIDYNESSYERLLELANAIEKAIGVVVRLSHYENYGGPYYDTVKNSVFSKGD